MKKTNLNRVISLVLVCVMLMGTFAINVFAEETESAPAAEIVSENVYMGEKLQFMFSVKADEGVNYELVVKDSEGNKIAVEPYIEEGEQVVAKEGLAYITKAGVSAQNIAEEISVSLEVDGVAVQSMNYSVLEYLYTRLIVNDDATDNQKKLYNALIDYADIADLVINKKENAEDPVTTVADYKFVHFTNVTVNGEESILVLPGALDLSDMKGLDVPDGHKVVWQVEEYYASDYTSAGESELEEIEVNENHLVLTATTVDASVAREVAVATFELGANGSASHVDGNKYDSDQSWTEGGYTLKLTSLTNVYGPAYDAKGNSCIKLGTSKAVGSFSFTVADDVTRVEIAVAKYKTNATKISINGTDYTLTNNSNDGAYDIISIDTTTTKTISFTTVSGGVRAMLNTVVFYAMK